MLASHLAGGDASAGFDLGQRGRRIGQIIRRCSTSPRVYETAGFVDVVSPGDSLALAIRDSQVVAYSLSNYLWRFPPGSQCEGDDNVDEIIPSGPRVPRMQ